jgi:hypothetical protein
MIKTEAERIGKYMVRPIFDLPPNIVAALE